MNKQGCRVWFFKVLLVFAACSGEETQVSPGIGGMGPSTPSARMMSPSKASESMPMGGAGTTAPRGGTAGRSTAGSRAPGGMAGMMAAAGMGAPTAGAAGAAGVAGTVSAAGDGMPSAGTGAAGMDPTMPTMGGTGTCCPDGDCLCHGPDPTGLTAEDGPYGSESYTIQGVGCVYYPTDAEPPFAAVTISDGFGGSGGCGSFQTGQWGPLFASHGIVAMIVSTGSGDQPSARGGALGDGVAAFKMENEKSDSPLFGKLAGRYGTSGFSMGGGGTTYASQDDPTLLSSVAVMPWGPVRMGVMVPTLVICGSSDGVASCGQHGTPAYEGIGGDVPKMKITVSSGHAGQPSAGGGVAGEVGLAFTKVFLEGDERWRPILLSAMTDDTNIQ